MEGGGWSGAGGWRVEGGMEPEGGTSSPLLSSSLAVTTDTSWSSDLLYLWSRQGSWRAKESRWIIRMNQGDL